MDRVPGTSLISALCGIIIGLVVIVVAAFIWWRIFRKAGFSGALGLLMLIPVVNIVGIIILAFSEWPVQRELRELRAWADQVMAMQRQAQPPAASPQSYTRPPQDPYGPMR